jgi:hypothetical protein
LDHGANCLDVAAAIGEEEGFEEVEEGFADHPCSWGKSVEFREDGETYVENLLGVVGGEFGG